MPRLSEAKKDVISCEKLRGAANEHRSADVRMGQPTALKVQYHDLSWGEPGELKHLSTRRKRKQEVISVVVASEAEEAQTGIVTAMPGL